MVHLGGGDTSNGETHDFYYFKTNLERVCPNSPLHTLEHMSLVELTNFAVDRNIQSYHGSKLALEDHHVHSISILRIDSETDCLLTEQGSRTSEHLWQIQL